MVRKLFGKRRETPTDERASRLVEESLSAMKARAQPCLRLVPGGDGQSRLGGVPDMAGAWPRYDGRPLCCVAQLDLAQARAAGGPDWLPDQGRLLFFYELEHGSWGLHANDVGSAIVLHEAGSAVAAAEPTDLPDEAKLPAYHVAFVPAVSYPGSERLEIDWSVLNTASAEALEQALTDSAPDPPMHQIGGYPCPVQNDDMEAECEKIAARLGRRGGDAADWRLLLQLDTDDDAGMMWGDVGSLYFWVREQDASAGDFSKIWMILQCH